MPKRTLQLRLYPSQDQHETMGRVLGLCRRLYNVAKEHREVIYRQYGESVSYRDQQNDLPNLKQRFPAYRNAVHSQVLQDVLRRVDTAFRAFFEGRNGYPNWKGRSDYRSFTYPQPGGKHGPGGFRYQDGRVYLSKIGWVRAFHEDKPPWFDPEACTPKTCTVKEDRVGEWWASITFNVPEDNLQRETADGGVVGLDAGITHLATLSNGTKITNPEHLRNAHKRLAKAQRDLSRKQKGSNNWHKQRARVAKRHRDVRRKRMDSLHKVSRHLAQAYRVVAVEGDLAGLAEQGGLCGRIQDAAWGTLFRLLETKLQEHGGQLVTVDPRGTTRTCHDCGHDHDSLSLEDREWRCPECGVHHDRDVNAARVIRQRALVKLQEDGEVPTGCGERTPVDTGGYRDAIGGVPVPVAEAGSSGL